MSDKLLHIAKLIEQPISKDLTFDMTTFGRDDDTCGTSACIAGYAVFLHDKDTWRKAMRTSVTIGHPMIELRGRQILGLSQADADELFMATSLEDGPHQIHEDLAEHVPNALRWMVLNNTYNWHAALTALGVEHTPAEEEDDDDEF